MSIRKGHEEQVWNGEPSPRKPTLDDACRMIQQLQQADRERALAKTLPRQLYELARKNIIVSAHLMAWELGGETSFEGMLILLVHALVEQNDLLMGDMLKMMPPRTLTKTVGEDPVPILTKEAAAMPDPFIRLEK